MTSVSYTQSHEVPSQTWSEHSYHSQLPLHASMELEASALGSAADFHEMNEETNPAPSRVKHLQRLQ